MINLAHFSANVNQFHVCGLRTSTPEGCANSTSDSTPDSTSNVNQNDVRADLADILVRNDDIRLTIQKIQNSVLTRDHDLADTAAALIKLQVADSPQLPTVLDIDHVLALQFGKQHKHTPIRF